MLALLLVLGADAAAPRLPRECRADADCILSQTTGCCAGGCGIHPYATTPAKDAEQRRRCTIVDCSANLSNEPERCEPIPPASDFRAACRGGQCVALRAKGDCSLDSECRVDWVSEARECGPCGCCPGSGTPIAVPASAPPPTPPRPLVKKEQKKPPPFGLNAGGPPGPPTPPNCSPCPAPPVARAVCSANRCVLQRE